MDDVVAQVRARCLALPEVTEALNHGDPSWVVRRRTVVQFTERNPDDRPGIWCPAPPGDREALVGADPDRFFGPRFGGRSWVGIYLDGSPDWEEIDELIDDAYRIVAPQKLVRLLDDLRSSTDARARASVGVR